MVLAVIGAVLGLRLADQVGLFGWESDWRPIDGNDVTRYHERSFRVARVIDGDTLDVVVADRYGGTTRVRLWGVDTPETHHPRKPPAHYGPEATAFARRCCAGDTDVLLRLVPGRTRGNHGRLLAYVTLPDGRLLNRILIAEGYGYADPRYDHPLAEDFASAQADARQARRGLWADLRHADLPYYYRDKLDLSAGR